MTYQVWWTRADGQAEISGGDFSTRAEAERSIDGFRSELLGQCAYDDSSQADVIRDGTIAVYERGE